MLAQKIALEIDERGALAVAKQNLNSMKTTQCVVVPRETRHNMFVY